MASASGGRTMKHAPGRVLVFPVLFWSTQFLLSELDFRVSFSPRLTVSWNRQSEQSDKDKNNLNILPLLLNTCLCFYLKACEWLLIISYLFIQPVTQGHCSGGLGGLESTQLQRHNVTADLPEGSEALLIPLHSWFISLKVLNKNTGKKKTN